jgi:hypothetical protein
MPQTKKEKKGKKAKRVKLNKEEAGFGHFELDLIVSLVIPDVFWRSNPF